MTLQFSESVCNDIQSYVYRLIDPRNGETFYVGKGKGNRVFAHINDGLNLTNDETAETEKLGRIRQIRESNLAVIHIIHRHGMSDTTALHVEAALIDAFPGLTNIQSGRGSGDFGPMHTTEIITKYELPSLDEYPEHKLVLISINRTPELIERFPDIYDQVRFAWRINPSKAEQAEFIVAVSRGVTLAVFKPEGWLQATKENFPRIATSDEPSRWGFVGTRAEPDIWEQYVGTNGKRIINNKLRHVQNPIRYWNI